MIKKYSKISSSLTFKNSFYIAICNVMFGGYVITCVLQCYQLDELVNFSKWRLNAAWNSRQ